MELPKYATKDYQNTNSMPEEAIQMPEEAMQMSEEAIQMPEEAI